MIRCEKCNSLMVKLEDTLLNITVAHVCPICQHIQWETPHWLQGKEGVLQEEVLLVTRQPFLFPLNTLEMISQQNEYQKNLDGLPEKAYRHLILGDWTPPEEADTP